MKFISLYASIFIVSLPDMVRQVVSLLPQQGFRIYLERNSSLNAKLFSVPPTATVFCCAGYSQYRGVFLFSRAFSACG